MLEMFGPRNKLSKERNRDIPQAGWLGLIAICSNSVGTAPKHCWIVGRASLKKEQMCYNLHVILFLSWYWFTYIYIYIYVWFSLPLSVCSGSLSQCWTRLGLVVGRSNSAAGPRLARPREKIVPPYALEALCIEYLVIVIWFLAYECYPFFALTSLWGTWGLDKISLGECCILCLWLGRP